MRLAPVLQETYFHHNPGEVQPLKDLFDVFHGQYVITKGLFGLDNVAYCSDDRNTTGKSIVDGALGEYYATTTINVNNLELQKQAARWTAVEVYKQRYYDVHKHDAYSLQKGFKERRLMLIADDTRGAAEWADRTEPDFALTTHYDERDLKNDIEVSLFKARGETLLDAAQTMSRYYQELVPINELDESLAGLNSSMTIARALGATSMECFEGIWNEAIEQPDARTAANYAYRKLMTE